MKYLKLVLMTSLLSFSLSSVAATKKKAKAAKDNKPMIEIITSEGKITLQLDRKVAPKTVDNFMAYVDKKFYDNTIFHRVIKNFMIQGGGFTQPNKGSRVKKDTQPPIKNEGKLAGALKNDRGTISMARTGDPHSATAQFFINHSDNNFLNSTPSKWGYAVFGRIHASKKAESEKTLDKIATTKTKPDDSPIKTITIISIRKTKPATNFASMVNQ